MNLTLPKLPPNIATPAYVLDEAALKRNLATAARIKKETGITTGAVGMITDPQQAAAIIANGQADFISLARAMLFNPRWPQHAAVSLGVELPYAPQYERAAPKAWRPGRTLGRLE